MNSLRRQLITLLCVWLVAFPLPPLVSNSVVWSPQPTALARDGSPITFDDAHFRNLNQSVWVSLFGEDFDPNSSILWLNEPLEDDTIYATGSTPNNLPFEFALTESRASRALGENGDRVAICAGVLGSGSSIAVPVIAMVVTSTPNGESNRRSRVLVIDDLPVDPSFFRAQFAASVAVDDQLDVLNQFLRQAQGIDEVDLGCTGRCKYIQFVDDALAQAVYDAERTAAEAERDRLDALAESTKTQAIASAKSALAATLAAVTVAQLGCIAAGFGCGPFFWLCQAACFAVAAALLAQAAYNCVQAQLAAINACNAAKQANAAQFNILMQRASAVRDAAREASARKAMCCSRACEGLDCPPVPSITIPPQNQ